MLIKQLYDMEGLNYKVILTGDDINHHDGDGGDVYAHHHTHDCY